MTHTVRLLSIDHDGPVRVRQLGAAGQGINWTVKPENFPSLITMISEHGGPGVWSVEAELRDR